MLNRALIATAFCAVLGVSSAVLAQRSLLVEPSAPISIADTQAPSANNVGIKSADRLALPQGLFATAEGKKLGEAMKAIPTDIASETLANLALRLLVVEAEYPETDENLLADRVAALLRLGKPALAQQLLAAVPNGLKDEAYHKQAFEVKVAMGTAPQEDICGEAEARMSETPSSWWQRWVVLCQAVKGEKSKAELGLSLLREQNEVSEFYERVLRFADDATPITQLPSHLTMQQYAWLRLIGDSQSLAKAAEDESSIAAQWANQKGAEGEIHIPTARNYYPNSHDMQLSSSATTGQRYQAFLAYALRKSLDLTVDEDIQQALLNEHFVRDGQVTLSPAWYDMAQSYMLDSRSGELAMLIVSIFTRPLTLYAPHDIANLVRLLRSMGLEADAFALAMEASKAAEGLEE